MTPRLSAALRQRRAVSGLATLTVAFGVAAAVAAPIASGSSVARAAAASPGAVSRTETISRVNLINGQNQLVDKRTFTVKVDQTHLLRDRQEINVSWTGAHPTGGLVPDPNSAAAAEEEYPVVLMMCRGVSSSSAPAAKQIAPDTCWTQTPGERVQISGVEDFPSYRLDRYASAADRALSVGVPSPFPSDCGQAPAAQHWVPFVAASGHVYPGGTSNIGGTLICDAGIPPEEAAASASLQPGNTTYAVSDLQGKGSARFVITTSESNASLGCSDTVPCSLVVIPVMGISCDPAGDSIPPSERPSTPEIAAAAFSLCSQTGAFKAGAPDSNPSNVAEDLAVSGSLWWSASNWRNRVAIPLTFAPPADECALAHSSTPVPIYGSYLLVQATQQWSPHFCLNPKLFSFQHVQTSEPEAKSLLAAGSINAAFQGTSPPTAFTKPVTQAPTAVTGFAVVYDIDNAHHNEYVHLHLDARLLAKLLTESYTSNATVADEDKSLRNPKTHQANPEDLAQDPEFQALNPGLPKVLGETEPASTILVDSADTDTMTALTSYINADPEARAWLNGKPDPWGMIVNPKYKGIKLPVSSFPLLDTFEPPGIDTAGKNDCLADSPAPWLPLVASPVEQPSAITLDMQFSIATSQIGCAGTTPAEEKLVAVGRESQGGRFLLGVTSLADASRYKLDTAALETQGGSTSSAKFTNSAGRSFAKPTDEGLRRAVAMMAPDDKVGSWPVPYAAMRTDKAGKSAYPGTMLVSTDVPTSGITKPLAADYAKFLDFAASAGQRPGFGIGQLPPGYLPLTAANGAGKMVEYTRVAAEDVAAQNGKVPSPSDPAPPSPSSTPTPSPTVTATESTPTPGDSDVSLPPVKSAPPMASSPAVATSPGPTTSTSSTPVALSLGTTAAKRSSTAGAVFPLMLGLALLAGAATVATWRVGRPRKPVS